MTQPLAIGTILKNQYRIVRLVGGGGMAWVYQVEELPAGSGKLGRSRNCALKPRTRPSRPRRASCSSRKPGCSGAWTTPTSPRSLTFSRRTAGPAWSWSSSGASRWKSGWRRPMPPCSRPMCSSGRSSSATRCTTCTPAKPPIIFRDMKPSNVMVTNAGLVKLIDFGIARTYKAGKKRDTVAMGSENYAAPEQWGKGQTDARSDVYALGATMYHLLANMAPTPAFLPSEPLPLANYNGALIQRRPSASSKRPWTASGSTLSVGPRDAGGAPRRSARSLRAARCAGSCSTGSESCSKAGAARA